MPAPSPAHAELLALLALRFSPGLGPRRIEALRAHFGSAHAALTAPLHEQRQVSGLDSKSLQGLLQPGLQARAQQEIERAARAGIALLGRGLPGYPEALEALSDPPAVLWVRGPASQVSDLPHTDLPFEVVPRAIGVVGTRQATPFALQWTRHLCAELARSGVTVVSGLARGIDTAAHTAALDAGGASLALLGCGVDVVYPAENAQLSRRLTVASEYPLGTRPATHHFPQRNRLIAALSAGSVIVEGDLKSGSMITATHALECGRTVFAVPGRPNEALSAGPHRLLREGAVLTESAADILEELGWEASPASNPAPTLPMPSAVITAPVPPATPAELNLTELTAEQQAIYAAVPAQGGALLDDLASAAGLSLGESQLALMMLQLGGLVDEVGGRYLRR